MYDNNKLDNSYEGLSGFFGSVSRFVFNIIQILIILSIFGLLIYLFIATPHEVVGDSMYPNFKNDEYLIGSKVSYLFSEPQRGDVVIFKYDEYVDYIKRVIGVPGDSVSLRNGQIYVNDTQIDESEYLEEDIRTNGGSFLREEGSINVQDGEYFTLGDNRPRSYDSRDFGNVQEEEIKGKIFVAIFPLENFRFVEEPNIY